MRTEVQSEMHLPGYYSLRDLNDNTGNGSWSLHQQNDAFGQYHEFFLKRPAMDVNKGCNREQLRQTMLTHENVFKNQIHELHRLYRIQRDMMNEMRSKQLHRHMMQGGTSQFSFYSSGMPVADDNGRQHTSNLFLNHDRVSVSGADSIQCEFRSMKDNILQSSYGPTQNGLRLKGCETSESGCKKLRRRLIDLELPADAYMNDEEEGLALSGVSVVESCLLSRKHEMTRDRDGNLSIHSGVSSGCNGDIPTMGYPHGWRNLNELVKLKEASASASTDVLGNITCSKEEMERHILSSNSHSGYQCLAKFSQDPQKGREEVVSHNNLHLENERQQKGWLVYNETGQIVSNGRSVFASFRHEDFPATSKSQQTDRKNSNEPVKKKLFGVEICERNHSASVEDSHLLISLSLVSQSNVENFESSSISSWNKLHSDVSQDITKVQGNPSFSRLTPSNKSSVTMMESPEVIQNKLLVNLRSIPSISTEAPSLNHLCRSSQLESKESRVSYLSNGFGLLNGFNNGTSASKIFAQDGPKNNCKDLGSMMDVKSSETKKADGVPPNGCQNEAISHCAAVFANGSSKQSPQRGLPWLKAVPSCNGSSSEERQGSSQMNLDSLRNSFQQLVDRTEMMRKSSFQSCVQDSSSATCALDAEHQRIGVGECSSHRKIHGCSIFDKPRISKDHPSSSTHSKPSYPAPAVDDTDSLKVGPRNPKAPDEMSPKLGEQHKVEEQIEKGLINLSADSRRHIDLNLSVVDDGDEEETQPTTCSSLRTNPKILVEIDLEAPVVDETELDVAHGFESSRSKLSPDSESFQSKHPPNSESVRSKLPPGFESFQSKHPPGSESLRSNIPPGFESFQSKHPPGFGSFQCKLKKPVDTLQVESREPHEGLITVAAEALVNISSSHMSLQVETFCYQSETSLGDPLHWFAETISSHKDDIQNEIELVSTGKNSVHEEILPDGMDYFEYMTLNLTEAKVEEIGTYKPQVFENSKNDNILLKRPRRGQARRARQRKDFQRDVLPTLSSLLINEVTEDLQTIEGLIQATGGTWKSSLSLKNTRKGGGRRKRRLQDSDSPPNATETCPPQTQLPNCREVAMEDHTSLFGWGKRTRRPPRQRYQITNPPLIIK